MQALAEQSRLVRLPLNKVGSLSKIRKALIQLEQEFDREPSIEELANYLDISQREVEQTLKLSSRHTSLDAPLIEGESSSLSDVLQNDNADFADSFLEYADSLKRETERSLSTLTFRQREIIKLYFGIGIDHPMSLEDIGDELGITRERVRQIKDKAILKLRSASRSKLLKSYLG
jgi:RNA polymerase primary sigma factor